MDIYREGNAATPSYVRFINTLPSVQPIDIYLSGHKVAAGLDYKSMTGYIPVLPGRHYIEVFLADDMAAHVINTILEVPVNTFMTVAVAGMPDFLQLMYIPDGFLPHNATPDKAYIRFILFSPNLLPVDVRVGSGIIIAQNLINGLRTEYIGLNPGRYDFRVYRTGTRELLMALPDLGLSKGKVYTVYIMGLNSRNSPIEAVFAADKAQ